MSFINVYVHYVWSTKNRFPLLDTEKLRQKVWFHILDNAREQGIHIDFVNGYTDHCHCLASLNHHQSIDKIVQFIKGESSHWINQKKICKEPFEWQDEYFAVSVSPKNVPIVREYIKRQEEHHRTISFDEEYNQLMKISKLKILPSIQR
jgi:putative transposase